MVKITKGTKKPEQKSENKSMKPGQDKGNENNPPVSKRYRIRLKTVEDVRRLLSVTLNGLRQGTIDVPVARALIYGGQVMLSVFEQGDLARQIKELEDRAGRDG